jgi:hypothetical protein
MSQESYVVRIYRRGRRGTGQLVGIVEMPGSRRQAGFHDIAGLSAILAQPRRHLRRPPRGQP